MTRCTDCEYPHLCRAARRPEDHLAPDGKYREILGCDVNEYIFGDEIACPREKRRSGRGRA